MEHKNEYFDDIFQIAVGNAVINLTFKDLDYNPDYSSDFIKNMRVCYMTSANAYGYEKVFEEPVELNTAYEWDLLQFDVIFIMSENYYGGGKKIVFTKDGITEIPDDNRMDASNPNPETNLIEFGSAISFTYRDDGKIGYVRKPYKFVAMHDIRDIIRYVSRDELYCEEGYAIFENNKFVYYPEKTLTLSEARDIDGEFQMLKSSDLSGLPSEIQNAQTLDELMEYSKTVYARAK